MAKYEIKVTEFICDAPKCTTVIRISEDEEMPMGFHGQVTEISQWGGEFTEWYACRSAHIRPAVISALANVQHDTPPIKRAD